MYGKQIPISPFDSAMVCPLGVGHTAVSMSIQFTVIRAALTTAKRAQTQWNRRLDVFVSERRSYINTTTLMVAGNNTSRKKLLNINMFIHDLFHSLLESL